MSGHGFQRLWEEQDGIQLRAVAALLRDGLLDDSATLPPCPDSFASVAAYVSAFLPYVGYEALEGLRTIAEGGVSVTVPWLAALSKSEDAGESMVRVTLAIRRADHDEWEASMRKSVPRAAQKRSAMPAGRTIVLLRRAEEITDPEVGVLAGMVFGLVSRVTSDRGVTFLEVLLHQHAVVTVTAQPSSALGAGSKRPRLDDAARLCCWTGPNAVSALREAGALLGLHTYNPTLIAGILNGSGMTGLPPASFASLTPGAVPLPASSSSSSCATAAPTKDATSGLLRSLSPEERRFYLPSPAYKARYLETHFNSSQQAAIVAAVKRGGITLIQGPPGAVLCLTRSQWVHNVCVSRVRRDG